MRRAAVVSPPQQPAEHQTHYGSQPPMTTLVGLHNANGLVHLERAMFRSVPKRPCGDLESQTLLHVQVPIGALAPRHQNHILVSLPVVADDLQDCLKPTS